MRKPAPIPLELLAPARNADIAIAAITAGADAVYMGASSHGARHAAANSVVDMARVAEYAHRFNAKVFATVNTIIYDDELSSVERLIHDLYKAGVDALIVQDMGAPEGSGHPQGKRSKEPRHIPDIRECICMDGFSSIAGCHSGLRSLQ